MNERERMRTERWAEATRGLSFDADEGLVRVRRIGAGDSIAAARHLVLGDENLGANRVMEALEQYGLAVRNDPGLADAFVGMGVVLARKGKVGEAVSAFRTALDRDEGHAEAHYRLAMALWTASRQDEAIAEMQALVADDDTHAKAHERLAIWQYYAGDAAAAWRHVQRAEELGQPVPPQFLVLLQGRMPDPRPGADDR
jgi:tetratricopeptide (TPR) repeat protein